MSKRKALSVLSGSFLWRLTFVNIAVMAVALTVSSYTIYNTACMLVEHLGPSEAHRNEFFNATLFQYLFIITSIGIIISSLLQMHFTRRIAGPIDDLIEAMEMVKRGLYPAKLQPKRENDEIGQLLLQFNALMEQLESNEQERKKLTTDLSHEIRTPLTNIAGYLKAMESGVIEGDVAIYRSLIEETERVTKMVEQLDDLTAIDHLSNDTMTRERLDIQQEVEKMYTLFQVSLTKKDIALQIDVEPIELYTLKEGLHHILTNLVDNAIQYYDGIGPITITGKRVDAEYVLAVSGPGPVIKEEHRAQLFNRFYRVDASRNDETGGRGLGLAIAKEMSRKMDGDLQYVPTEPTNTFELRIPIETK